LSSSKRAQAFHALLANVQRLSGVGWMMRRSDEVAHVLTKTELARVLGCYQLAELKAAWRSERGFVNDNWIVETTQGRYFLKHRHPSLCQPDLSCAQHALITWLRQGGFPAPALVPTVEGETLLLLDGQCYEVQVYIEGAPYDHDRPAHLEEAAVTLGHYHTLVAGFAPAALCGLGDLYHPTILSAKLASLTQAWEVHRDPDLAPIVSQLAAQAADLATRFAGHGTLPQLVIHGDYYAGNLLFDGERVVGVLDYDKARWQPRVVELAEALIYFASPRPGHLKHLVYPGVLNWEPFTRFLQAYARHVIPNEHEARALPDFIRCIWLQIALQRLLENRPRPGWAREALQETLALGNWASANAPQMIETSHLATEEPS
jgi:homoserine kinase type II